MDNVSIFNEDCIAGAQRFQDESVDLIICDPPFGIGEASFNKHYKRDSSKVFKGYVEAPQDYAKWTLSWMNEATRILKPDGALYVIMGHSNLVHVLNAAAELGLYLVNHLIWKYNFGVNTRNKFVTSHYHGLYYTRSKKSSPTFNTHCRFGPQEKDDKGGSLLYQDMEDVFFIKKDYAPGEKKNQNKLPDELVRKLILYSSNEGDLVVDFFMGNFTTAYVGLSLGRRVGGFELNAKSFKYHYPKLKKVKFGYALKDLKNVEIIEPKNKGRPISDSEALAIYNDFISMLGDGSSKKSAIEELQKIYQRGKFSIINIIGKQQELEEE